MAVTSARAIVGIKEKGHFEHEDARIEKYTLADELPEKLSELRLRPLSLDKRPLGLDQRPLGMDQRPLSKDKRPGYTVRRLGPQDKEQTLQFLRRFFFRDEPMNQAIQLLETPDSRCEELEDYAAATLDEEVSFAVVDDQGEFAGVIINGIVRREDALAAAAVDKSSECPDPKFRRILSVLGHLERAARVWEQLAGAPVLEVRIASTHSAWRGRGLMRVLCEETERLAKQLGCGALRMDATSAFSAAAAERLGYRCVYRVKYTDLPEAPVPDPPHTEARVYLKEI
ncbi:arylalkylamine N-acetyltransferase 1-like [Plutella xylostella]|uniref:arylalkylamine N-acetyltransferase 1-like n=1 Tax=Plutella xylostella TaxID=51655 RepID=UPI00203245D9|nr:arylalkylamine N-acetyltransferase 1-like [Plutella xylostella]